MDPPTPKINPSAERILKADDCRISSRLAHIQLTSFNLHAIIGLPEAQNRISPVIPAIMPKPVTQREKQQQLDDSGLLGSAALEGVARRDEWATARDAGAWLAGLAERANQGTPGNFQDPKRTPSKGRRMSKPTPQKPAKKLRIIVNPPPPEHGETNVQSAPLVCPSKRTAQLKGEALPTTHTLRTTASLPTLPPSHPLPHHSPPPLQRPPHHPTLPTTTPREPPPKTPSTEPQSHANSILLGPTYPPASPPPAYLSPRSSFSPLDQPIYWTCHLSTTLSAWLCHPDTLSVQHPVQQLTLSACPPAQQFGAVGQEMPVGGPRVLVQLGEEGGCKLKVLRILLPPSVSQEFAERDWVVISCTQQPPSPSASAAVPAKRPATSGLRLKTTTPPTSPGLIQKGEEEREVQPHLLLALPVSSLIHTSTSYPASTSLAPPPDLDAPAVYPFDSSNPTPAEESGTGAGAGVKDPGMKPHTTRILVHSPGVVPLVHGKDMGLQLGGSTGMSTGLGMGMSMKGLGAWLGAASSQQRNQNAVMELRSLGPIPIGKDIFATAR